MQGGNWRDYSKIALLCSAAAHNVGCCPMSLWEKCKPKYVRYYQRPGDSHTFAYLDVRRNLRGALASGSGGNSSSPASRTRPNGTYLDHEHTQNDCNLLITNSLNSWRRGESNPRPKSAAPRSLHAYPGSGRYSLARIAVLPAALRTSKKRSQLVRSISPEPCGPKGLGQLTV
jgi:hypothetical protein